jgi:anti-sigma28 factor (negative regulator of flagellin synthesis)
MAVGMKDSSRHLTHRRSPESSAHQAIATAPMAEHISTSSAARVEALRRLVAAGQYHVSAKWLAHRIFRCAGIPFEE